MPELENIWLTEQALEEFPEIAPYLKEKGGFAISIANDRTVLPTPEERLLTLPEKREGRLKIIRRRVSSPSLREAVLEACSAPGMTKLDISRYVSMRNGEKVAPRTLIGTMETLLSDGKLDVPQLATTVVSTGPKAHLIGVWAKQPVFQTVDHPGRRLLPQVA